jgi:hypothetical protein
LPVITQSSESLQEFAAAVERLAYQALFAFHTYFILREAAFAFISGVKDLEGEPHLLVSGKR